MKIVLKTTALVIGLCFFSAATASAQSNSCADAYNRCVVKFWDPEWCMGVYLDCLGGPDGGVGQGSHGEIQEGDDWGNDF